MPEPDLTAELDAAEAVVMGDDATCRHCGEPIVPCGNAIRYCQGWRHVAGITSHPLAAHFCGGRSVNGMAEPSAKDGDHG